MYAEQQQSLKVWNIQKHSVSASDLSHKQRGEPQDSQCEAGGSQVCRKPGDQCLFPPVSTPSSEPRLPRCGEGGHRLRPQSSHCAANHQNRQVM